jgi:tetratricopeptide (TPR) repeat protein
MSYQKSPFELKLWEKTKSEDMRERAEAFGRLAEYTHGQEDFATSLTCAKQSTMLYEELNDSFGQAEGYFFEGKALRGQDHNAEALVKLEKSAEFFRANPNEFFLAAILLEQGHAYSDLEQFGLAKGSFENAMNLFVAEELWASAGIGALMSAEMLYKLKDFAQCEFYSTRALDMLAKGDPDFVSTARAYKVRGDSHTCQGDFTAACADYWESYHLLEYVEFEGYKVEVLLDLSEALIYAEDYDAALPLLSQARSMAGVTGVLDQAKCDLFEAHIKAATGEPDEATKLYTRARSAFKAGSSHYFVFDCDYRLGKLLQRTDHLKASVQFEKALEQAEQSEFEPQSHIIYVDMAKSYLDIGRADAVVTKAHLVDLDKLPGAEAVAAYCNYVARAKMLMGENEQAVGELGFILDETNTEIDGVHRLYALETKARALLATGDAEAAKAILAEVLFAHALKRNTDSSQRIATLIQDCTLKISQDQADQAVSFQVDNPSDSIDGVEGN